MFGTHQRFSRSKYKERAKNGASPRAPRHVRHRSIEALEARQLLAATEPIINEFMASNKTGITDLCGQTSDWIEIYNPTAAPVNMAGWHLTDDIAIPDKWTFPSINVNANGYLLVWAGDCNQVDPARPQASFKLDPNPGEYLALTRPDNTHATEFNPTYPQQVNDTSYGLSSTGVYQYMTSETPGAANIDGATGIVADTKFDVDRGLFNAPFQLNITTLTAGATIRYTTNGSPPTATTGTVYSGPISIDHTTTLRAAAFKTGYISSDVDTETYLFIKDVINQPNLKISSIVRVGTVATVTTPVPHGFTSGATVLIYGADQTQYNTPVSGAPFTITSVPTPTTFTYTVVSTAVTPATGVNLRIGNPPNYPGNWLTYADGTPATADYEMDPEIVNDPAYANRIIDAMSSIPSLSIVMPINDLFNNANSPIGTGGIYPYSFAGQDADIPLKTVSSIVRLGIIATATLPAHGYVNGDRIWIQNANQVEFNGTFTIFGVTANTFQYNVPSTAASAATGTPIYAQKKTSPQLWERGTSVEWINPDGSKGFQVNAGVQIQGNASREPNKSGKHSFRLLFKTQYGASNLNYPVFGDAGASSFDSLILKAGFNNSWIHWDTTQRGKGTLISDRWASDTQIAMGDVSKHGQFVHLYLNGIYWGVYDVMERPEADFAASQFGGNGDDYDVMNNEDKLIDGNRLAWDQMFNLVNNTDLTVAANYNAVKPYLDMPSFIDYILLNYYGGNLDWDDHNWYAARHSRVDGVPANVRGFHFFSYDAENILNGTTDYGPLSLDTDHRPTRLFQRLKNNSDFRQLIADRIHATFFNDGALTPTAAAARYRMEMAQVDPAVIGESARWGDYRKDVNQKAPNFNGTGILFTRDNHWVTETNRILSTYFPIRTFNILQQMRTLNLYPNMDAPEFNQLGGTVSPGFSLTMTNVSGGTVYYTLDGSDPRLSGGNVAPGVLTYTGPVRINSSAQVKARVYNPVSRVWSAITDFNFHVSPPPSLRITELMYNPQKPLGSLLDDDEYQYIELQNTGLTPLNLNGIILRGVDNFIFPNIMLSPGARTLVVANQAAFESVYGAGLPIAGVFVGRLDHGGEKITLQTALGQIIEQFTYKDGWYNQTDGDGYSLVAVDPNATNDILSTQEGWRASTTINGAPGASDPGLNNNSIVISEVLNNTAADPWIEFKNQTGADIDISGWYLTNDLLNLIKYTLPAGSIVPANGYLTLLQSTSFGAVFSLSFVGGDLKLSSSYGGGQLGGYRDSVDFAAADPEVTFGRYIKSTGGSDFTAMSSSTPGAANSAPLVGPVVINEVMYNPSNGADEYIEIKNISGAPIALHDGANGWQFTSGVGFTFAPGASLAIDEIALIVPIDPAVFRAKYSIPAAVQIFGPYTGTLSNNGEKLALGKPIPALLPPTYVQVDRVNYNDGDSWPIYADGRGSSLQRNSATAYPNDLANWSASASGGTPGATNLLKYAPAVNAGPDASVNEAALFTANGSFVDLDAGETWSATVYWGDSGTASALTLNANKTFTLNHNYVDNGVYTIIVTVTDSGKLFGIDTVTVTVNNVAPNGTTTGGAPVNEGIAGSVNVATRTDVSTLDTSAGFFYNFDFDNNGTFEITNSTTPTIAVPAAYMDGPGVRPIHIRLVDKDGGFRDFTQNLTVNNNNPPTATLINSGNVNEGAAGATVTFSVVNDVLADLASIRYAYDIDNDGTFDIGDGTYAGSAGNTNTANVPASLLAESGSRTIRGRVMDKDGGVNTYNTIILVNNVAPTATIANSGPAPEGSTTTTVSFSNIADSPGDLAAGFTYSYDFDNDSNFDLTGSNPSAIIPASFLADGPSSRTVAVRITDRDGGSRDYTTIVTVNNVAPTIAAISNKTVGMGSPLTVNGSVSDPGFADTFTATIDYGDGAGQQPLTINPDRTFTLSKTYNTPGLYTATVRVTDKDGGVATPTSFTVNVRGSTLVGTAADDTYYIRLDASHANVEFYENTTPPNAPTFVIPVSSLTNISISAQAGADILTVDLSNTNPLPSGGLNFDAGAGPGEGTLTIIGDGAVDAVQTTTTPNTGLIMLGGRPLNFAMVPEIFLGNLGSETFITPRSQDSITLSFYNGETEITGLSGNPGDLPGNTVLPDVHVSNSQSLIIDAGTKDSSIPDDTISIYSTGSFSGGSTTLGINSGAGNNYLSVDRGVVNLNTNFGGPAGANLVITAFDDSVVNLPSSQTLKFINLNDNSRMNIAGSGKVLRTSGLTLHPNAILDLDSNDMIVQATAGTRQTLLASIAASIKSARNTSPTRWQGKGITSSAAGADATRITGLAAILNDNGGGVLYPTFDGQSVDINSILVKYTYEGDANVSGQINADDYAAIDSGFASHATGYANGDFDWSGSINSDDFFTIDRAYSAQGATLGGVIEPPRAPLAAEVTPSSPSTPESAPDAPVKSVGAASAAVPPATPTETAKRSKHRHHKRSVDDSRVWNPKTPNSDSLTRFLRRF